MGGSRKTTEFGSRLQSRIRKELSKRILREVDAITADAALAD